MKLKQGAEVKLAKMIILQAITDYLLLNKWYLKHPEEDGSQYWYSRFCSLLDTRDFFFSNWFKQLTNYSINPHWLVSKMDKAIILQPNCRYFKNMFLKKIGGYLDGIWTKECNER